MPRRFGMLWVFVRWSLGFAGIGRRAGSFEVGEMWMSRAALLARYRAARDPPGLEVRG